MNVSIENKYPASIQSHTKIYPGTHTSFETD